MRKGGIDMKKISCESYLIYCVFIIKLYKLLTENAIAQKAEKYGLVRGK